MFCPLTIKRLVRLAPIFVSVSALLSAAPAPTAGEASGLFQEAKTTAAQLKRDVIEMESYARSSLSWQSHATQITRITEHINKAGQLAAQLEKSRVGAETWHQTAIDRLTPLLRELASNVEAMIKHINKQTNMNDPAYNSYLKENEDLATELSNLISDTVDYDKTKAEMQKL